ncbi:RNA polymerase sigma factor RpoH [Ignatzschineria ureiclastica]|uniref:RNA polymerase sigma factor RpoH n=1 Tax=Ignatzschineria ureiclastica TaxID=472582 RepID=A0A2U2AH71_9GAMM|nr:RNA polymerase sigma factor RpoH [Ignatzschineria ureiclastica]PWD81991.1 RNA polymerase sigma factor RpoH [Ignatzschineria ureiclastica]GGZ91884.1 RNA polymerase sigma factor RpoH [Ignatzschineria ureiclastica]
MSNQDKQLVLRANTFPSVADGLDAYISAISDIPTLTAEEEQALAYRLLEHQDLNAAQTLILSHLKFVVHIAKNYTGYGLPLIDLIQEGNVGLMKAVKRFDPAYNVRLISFAVYWIKSEIHEYVIRNWRIVKVATTKAQRKLFFNLRSSKENLDWLTDQEASDIAKELKVSKAEVKQMEMRLFSNDIAFDLPVNSSSEDGDFSPSDWLASHNADPSQQLEKEDYTHYENEKLSTALAELDPRSKDIIMQRWMQDEDEARPTLTELADKYEVSAERIRQIENQAMNKIKDLLTV